MKHATIMMERKRNIISTDIGKEQFGFVEDKWHANAILTMKSTLKKINRKTKYVTTMLHRIF